MYVWGYTGERLKQEAVVAKRRKEDWTDKAMENDGSLVESVERTSCRKETQTKASVLSHDCATSCYILT